MKSFTYISPELEDLDLGMLGMWAWVADVNIIGESDVLVIRAVARKWNGTALREIDITTEIQQDKELKEQILAQYIRKLEHDACVDVNRAYDEWKNGDGAA